MRKNKITYHYIKAKDGSTLVVFYNRENDLLVVDKTKGIYGNEFIRMHPSNVKLPDKTDFEKRKLRKVM